MNTSNTRIGVWGGALATVLLFGVVYAVTVAPGAYPGVSARLVSEQTGLTPLLSPAYPLWRSAAWVLRQLPFGDLALKLNLLSVVCGSLALGLLYVLMHDAVLLLPDTGTAEPDRRTHAAAHLSAVTAVLFLGFSIPFWQVATRAHFATPDLLLLLGAGLLLLTAYRRGRYLPLLLFATLFSVGMAGFATMIALLPLAGLALVYTLWRHELVSWRHVLGLIAAACAGAVVLLLAAWHFQGTAGYELREYESFGQVVWYALRDLYRLLLRGLPRTGWLIILFVSIIPWVVTLIIARRGLNDERDRGSALLHLILVAMALSVLLNSRFAPWSILGAGRMLVTPYLLMAMVCGYAAAYWFLLPGRWWPRQSEGPVTPGTLVGAVLVAPLVGLLLWAPVRNIDQTDGRPAGLVQTLAEAVVDALDGRTWLVTDGSLDTHIQLAAYERGIPLKVLAAMPSASAIYRRYTASLFEDPQLRNLAGIGVLPLLREWMRRDPDVAAKLAIMVMPELWISGGYDPLPAGLVYLGVPRGMLADHLPDTLPGPYAALWDQLEAVSTRRGDLSASVRYHAVQTVRHAGRLANNLGVALEDAGRDADAAAVYQRARRIDPDNISALLNLGVMLEQGRLEDPAGAVALALETLDAATEQRFEIGSLAHHYGTVRLPQAYADVGWRWALSGRAELAAARLEQALAMTGVDRSQVQLMIARLQLAQGEREAGTDLLQELLDRHPGEPALLLQMARQKARHGELAEADVLIARAREAGAPALALATTEALTALARREPAAVREHLRDVSRRHPEHVEIWTLLCEAALMEGDMVRFEDALKRLESVEGARGYHRSLLRGRVAMMNRDFENARGFFETALAQRPQNAFLLETLLQLSVLLRRSNAAQAYVERLLILNQQHPLALHVLGTLQVEDGALAAAAASMRASLALRETPALLNDLAWVLALLEEYEEAERLSRRSIELLPGHYTFHDTLGTILMRTGRYEAAAAEFEQSLAIAQYNPGIVLRMAECKIHLGNTARAESLIEPLVPRLDELSRQDRETLLELRRKLRQ